MADATGSNSRHQSRQLKPNRAYMLNIALQMNLHRQG